MKKTLLFFSSFLLSFLAISQGTRPITGSFGAPSTTTRIYNPQFDSSAKFPINNTYNPGSGFGYFRVNPTDSSAEIYKGPVKGWQKLGALNADTITINPVLKVYRSGLNVYTVRFGDTTLAYTDSINNTGYLALLTQSTSPAPQANTTLLFRDSANQLAWRNSSSAGGYIRSFGLPTSGSLTANRTYRFQDKSYVVADSSDVALKLNATDTLNKWLRYIQINGSNDSLVYYVSANRYAVKIPTGSGGSSTFAGLTDVNTAAITLADKQFTRYNNSTGKWENFDLYANANTWTAVNAFNTTMQSSSVTLKNWLFSGGIGGTRTTVTQNQILSSTGTLIRGYFVGDASTPTASDNAITFLIGGTQITEASSGTHPLIAGLGVKAPVITDGTGSTTNATALYVDGPPTGTATPSNVYSAWIAGGKVRSDGSMAVGTSNFSSNQFTVVGSGTTSATNTVAFHNSLGTSNSLIVRDDGNVGIGVASPSNLLTLPGMNWDKVNGKLNLSASFTSAGRQRGQGLFYSDSATGTPLSGLQGLENGTTSYLLFATNKVYGPGGWADAGNARKGMVFQVANEVLSVYQYSTAAVSTAAVGVDASTNFWINTNGTASSKLDVRDATGTTFRVGHTAGDQYTYTFGRNTSTGYLDISPGSGNSTVAYNFTGGPLLITGFQTAYVAKTAAYTATATDHTIDGTTGTFTVTLPTASGITGRRYIIKNSGTGTITVGTTSSQTIDGATTYSLNAQYKFVEVQSNGSNWIIISN